jgi:filamentous hemagglutinin
MTFDYGFRMSGKMQNSISALSKSGMGSFGWSGTGVWAGASGKNMFNPNNVPAIGAGIGGAAGGEAGMKAINDAKSQLEK